MYPTYQRERGAIAVMVAISMVVLIAVVGLVVDGGLAFMVKARLNAAVDSAALAAGRAVSVGNTQADQTASAQAAAAQFFAANIPDGYLLSRPTLTGTKVQFNAGTVTIDVTAEAPMPVSLMRVLGFSSMTPVAAAQTVRKDLDMAFVVDTSGSLSSQSAGVKTAAKSFLNKFNVAQDRVSLIHFAWGAEVDNPINASARGFARSAMVKNIDGYTFKGNTASVEGMWHARDQLDSITPINRSTLRVIVFFSDGVPNSFGSYLTYSDDVCKDTPGVLAADDGLYKLDESTGVYVTDPKCRLPKQISSVVKTLPEWYNAHNPKTNRNDPARREFRVATTGLANPARAVNAELTASNEAGNIDRAARNLPEAVAAKAREDGIFVFTLGMGSDLRKVTNGEIGENILKCMANVADGPSRCYDATKPVGMYCYAATEADLTPCFSRLASAILRISK
jgi:Flp pilus assembly protein TadG